MSDEDTIVLLKTSTKSTSNLVYGTKVEEEVDFKEETYQEPTEEIFLSRSQSILSSISTIISGVIFGYDLGVSTNLIKPISSILNLSCTEHVFVEDCWLFGVLLSATFGGYVIDILGRRGSITVSMIMLLINSLLLSVPDLVNVSQVYALSRFVSGFAGPLSAIAQCIYMAELSEPENRGFKISLHQFGMAFGGLLACIPILLSDAYSGWSRFLMQIVGFHACWVIYITLYWLPHSVMQVNMKNPVKKAKLYRLEFLLQTIGIAVAVFNMQLACGRDTVLLYSPRIYSLLGICVNEAAKLSVTLYNIIRFLAFGFCLLIIDRLNRRTALILSSTVMMICLYLLALLAFIDDPDTSPSYFYHDNCDHLLSDRNDNRHLENPDAPYALPKSPPPYPMLPTPLSLVFSPKERCPEEMVSNLSPSLRIVGVVSIILYQVADVLMYGMVIWIILSEIFPTSIRGRCIYAITWIYWINIGTPGKKYIQPEGFTFLIYSFCCLIVIITMYIFIPETRNKRLEQISEDLRKEGLPSFGCDIQNLSANKGTSI